MTIRTRRGHSSWQLWWCGLSRFSSKYCSTSALSSLGYFLGFASTNRLTGSPVIGSLVTLSLSTLAFLSSIPPSPLLQVPQFCSFLSLCVSIDVCVWYTPVTSNMYVIWKMLTKAHWALDNSKNLWYSQKVHRYPPKYIDTCENCIGILTVLSFCLCLLCVLSGA